MKKIFLILTIILFLTSLVVAENDSIIENTEKVARGISKGIGKADSILDGQILIPGQFGYTLKRFGEGLRLFFTFTKQSRINYRIELANRRVSEIRRVVQENKPEYINDLAEDYITTLEKLNSNLDKLKQNTTQVQTKVSNITIKHIEVLNKALQTSEDSNQKLGNAINISINTYIKSKTMVAEQQGKTEQEVLQIKSQIKEQIREKIRKGKGKSPKICIQVITPAKNPQTGECKNFPTPCDVPDGWMGVDSCDNNNTIQIVVPE